MSATKELIDRYAIGPATLEYAVHGLTDEQLRAHPGPGAWSIIELVAHLADADCVIADRIKRTLAEPEPALLGFDETAWNDRLRMRDASLENALALFRANRTWTEGVLRRADDADFKRRGVHSERGPVALADLVVGSVTHLDHHLKFLYAKRANLRTAIQPRYSYPIV
ncbi:DinB family protein [Paludisphaera sp.]|uniref:DinB family protein n=1 Tax=Paludisphaera sp. TaxID=2017432 RepID=UPI00301D8161